MKKIKHFLTLSYKSRFVRNVALVASGTAGAQAITIAFSPIITRMYGPEAFGVLGVFIATAALVSPISALCYPVAIVLPKEDNEAIELAKLSAYSGLGMTVLVFILLVVAEDWIVHLLHIQKISSFMIFLPLNIIFNAWLQINQQWLIRKKKFRLRARIAVVQALIVNSAKVGIGFFRPLAVVLIVITTLGNGGYAAMLAPSLVKTYLQNRDAGKNPKKKSLLKLAKKYYDFPSFRAPQVFINDFSRSVPVLLLATFFGPVSAGFYTLCKRVLEMPAQLVAKSVGDVFYPRITEAANKGENLDRLIIKATLSLGAIGILPFAIVSMIGPWLFGIVFGPEWTVAGGYARWLALFMFFSFINNPSVTAIPVLGLQKGLLIYELLSTAGKLLALFFGFIIFKDDLTAVALFSVFGALAYIFLIYWVVVSSRHFSRMKRSTLKTE